MVYHVQQARILESINANVDSIKSAYEKSTQHQITSFWNMFITVILHKKIEYKISCLSPAKAYMCNSV